MTIGTRVEIPAYIDAWMRGDRYGEIVAFNRHGLAIVLLDKSQKRLHCEVDELRPV
jgi:hypothetical protein